MIATGIDDDEAVAVLPDRSQSIAVRRQPIWHPILGNEFRRSIILSNAGQQVLRIEIEPDTGGYILIHVYDMTEGNYLLTDGLTVIRWTVHADMSTKFLSWTARSSHSLVRLATTPRTTISVREFRATPPTVIQPYRPGLVPEHPAMMGAMAIVPEAELLLFAKPQPRH
jgi:hypothetical protein